MQWLNDNYVTLLAIVGGLYTVARLIVSLTPTPKDDAKLAEVTVWLKSLAKLVGLDLKQGIKKKNGSGGTTGLSGLLILVVPLLIFQGCGSKSWSVINNNPRAKFIAYGKVFKTTVDSCNILIQEDVITDFKVMDEIVALAEEGYGYLGEWEAHLSISGNPPPDLLKTFYKCLTRLSDIETEYVAKKMGGS